jgi:hypothetical protein
LNKLSIGGIIGTGISLLPIPGASILGGGISLVCNVATGNFVSAGLDVVSMIPGGAYVKLVGKFGTTAKATSDLVGFTVAAADVVNTVEKVNEIKKVVNVAVEANNALQTVKLVKNTKKAIDTYNTATKMAGASLTVAKNAKTYIEAVKATNNVIKAVNKAHHISTLQKIGKILW